MVRLCSLGECVIDLGGVRVGPESEVLFALLLYLVVERGHRVPRARLVELLWPGEEEERARHNLRQAIYKAKQLGAAIAQDGGDVVLPAAEGWADYDALSAEPAEPSAPALDLEGVDFLPSYDGGLSDALAEWVESRRAIVQSMVRRHLAARIARARRLAQWADVERLARRCLELDPMNEEAVIGLAEATAVTGSRAQAMAILDRYLAELGADAKVLGRPARELRRRIGEISPERTRESRLIGREQEMSILTDRLERAIRGEGGAFMLWGAAGIGKSALVDALTRIAHLRGLSVATVYCQYTSHPQPLSVYSSLVEALMRLPGGLGCSPEALELCQLLSGRSPSALGGLEAEAPKLQGQIHEAALELALSVEEEAPLFLMIEDAHWADSVSIERLAAFIHALRQRRVLLLLTGRPSLPAFWPDPTIGALSVLELRGLSDIASTCLLHSRLHYITPKSPSYTAWCLQVAEGHPLYLRELGDRWQRAGENYTIPSSLASLLETRIAALSSEALRTLQFCALLSRSSTIERLERSTSLTLRDLTAVIEELENNDVACVSGAYFVLRHELIGEAALATLSEGTRRILHKRVALTLETELRTSSTSSLPWQCAQHWLAAGEPLRAGEATEIAAERLIEIGLPGEAAALLRRYLSTPGTVERQARALDLLIEAERHLGEWNRVIESARAAEALSPDWRSEHTPRELHVIEAAWRSDDIASSTLLASLERCVSAPGVSDEHRLQAAIQGLIIADDVLDATAFRRIFATAARTFPLKASSSLLVARLHLIFHSISGDIERAVTVARRCIALAEATSNPVTLALCLRNALIPLRLSARFSEAIVIGRRALAVSIESGIPESIATSAANLALLHIVEGESTQAQALSEEALGYLPQLAPHGGRRYCQGTAATVALFLGDIERARILTGGLPTSEDGRLSRFSAEALACHALVAVHSGEREKVGKLVPRLMRVLTLGEGRGGQDTIAVATIGGLSFLGRDAEAAALRERYVRHRREKYALPTPLLGPL